MGFFFGGSVVCLGFVWCVLLVVVVFGLVCVLVRFSVVGCGCLVCFGGLWVLLLGRGWSGVGGVLALDAVLS